MLCIVASYSEQTTQWRIQEFPEGERGTNSESGIILQIFCRKLHENEKIWTLRCRPWRFPSPGSANTTDAYLELKKCDWLAMLVTMRSAGAALNGESITCRR